MTTAIDTLAKVDLHCHFDGTLSPEILVLLAHQRDELLTVTQAKAQMRATDAPTLLAARAWVRAQLRTAADLELAALDLGRRLIRQIVVHIELHVDPLGYPGLTPLEVLSAIERGLTTSVTELDDLFLSWVLVMDLQRSVDGTDAEALVREMAAMRGEYESPIPKLSGVAIAGDNEKNLGAGHLRGALAAAKELGLGRVITAGEHGPKDRVAEALDLGAQRIVGGLTALGDANLVLQMRAHRLPVVLLPTEMAATAAVRAMASLPVKKMKDAGLFVTIGSGWPTLLGTTLTGEYEMLAKHHHWRLDDIRNVTTRAIEAAFMDATLRFQLARTIEVWRHRPVAPVPGKGDNWSL